MKNITTGQRVVAQGQDLLLVVEHSSDVNVSIKTTGGTFVPMILITEDSATYLPGYPGATYQITFASGLVDIHGACQVLP